ncbi:hypothetical protein [Rhizobium sp. RAF56]|uniref:hypothetical protein n=1 Tax=Rhizobium sp. RAF56 TaxID=3233062 RepID=UPI003F9CB2EA
MSFAQEMKDFNEGFKTGSKYWSDREDDKLKQAQVDYYKARTSRLLPATDSQFQAIPSPFGGGGKSATTNHDVGDVAWKDAPPEARALLNTIAGPESGGAYNIKYGGSTFDGYDQHPGDSQAITSGPNAGKTSSAAGRYQFLKSTYNDLQRRYGLKDFSPENQDKAAWYYANEVYQRNTHGRDLAADLKSGDPQLIANVGKNLSSAWTSLPSGMEQGTNTNAFVSNFDSFLKASRKDVASAAPPVARASSDGQTAATDPTTTSSTAPPANNMATPPPPKVRTPQVGDPAPQVPQPSPNGAFVLSPAYGDENPDYDNEQDQQDEDGDLGYARGGIIPDRRLGRRRGTQYYADGGFVDDSEDSGEESPYQWNRLTYDPMGNPIFTPVPPPQPPTVEQPVASAAVSRPTPYEPHRSENTYFNVPDVVGSGPQNPPTAKPYVSDDGRPPVFGADGSVNGASGGGGGGGGGGGAYQGFVPPAFPHSQTPRRNAPTPTPRPAHHAQAREPAKHVPTPTPRPQQHQAAARTPVVNESSRVYHSVAPDRAGQYTEDENARAHHAGATRKVQYRAAAGGVIPQEEPAPPRNGTVMLDPNAVLNSDGAPQGRMLNAGSSSPRIYEGSTAAQVRDATPANPVYADPSPGPAARPSGVLPSPDEADQSAGQASPPPPSHPPHRMVAEAIHNGVLFLQDTFGLKGSGAINTPDDQGRIQGGQRRFAQGEGAATPQEVKQVDSKIDPDNQIPSDQKQAVRLAQMTQFYLEQGRTKDAAASAGSLLLYGAQQFSRLGSLAGVALNEFQQDHDPIHIKNAVKILNAAYDLIPDGGGMDINIDPRTGMITATHNVPGEDPQTLTVQPNELPQLLKGMQDGSMYWDQILRTADPTGAHSRDNNKARAVAAQQKREQGLSDQLDREGRQESRYQQHTQDNRAYRESHPTGAGGPPIDENAFNSARAVADAAQAEYKRAADASEKPDADLAIQALRDKRDEAASRLSDTLPVARRGLMMKQLGYEGYTYRAPPANAVTSAMTNPVAPENQAALGGTQAPAPSAGSQPAQPQTTPQQAAPQGGGPRQLPPGVVFDRRSGQYIAKNPQGKWAPVTLPGQ